MKTLRMMGSERVEVIELPEPDPVEEFVVVKIMASAICGSEMRAFRSPKPLPNNAGHEAAGIVARKSAGGRWKEGDRVVLYAGSHCGVCEHCRLGYWILCQSGGPAQNPGSHTQYVLVNANCCLPLPDDISFEHGTLVGDVLGTPFHAIQRMGVGALDTVLIAGLGPVGLSASLICKFLNATVIATDIVDYRLQVARDIGVDHVIDSRKGDAREIIRDLTAGAGVDKAIDCTGQPGPESLCLDAVRRRGAMAFVGENHESVSIRPSEQLIRKDLNVIGSWYYNVGEYDSLLRLLKRGVPVQKIITHHFPLENAQQAFTQFAAGRSAKTILFPWQ